MLVLPTFYFEKKVLGASRCRSRHDDPVAALADSVQQSSCYQGDREGGLIEFLGVRSYLSACAEPKRT